MDNFYVYSKGVNEKDNILDLGYYNGRVNIVQPPNNLFLHEKIPVNNKVTDYTNAISGELETSLLSKVYFSAENIQIIHNALVAKVYEMSNGRYKLMPQNIDNLKVVMKSYYLQYAEHKEDNITQQIERLNKLVIDDIVPRLYGNAISYEKYTHDQSTIALPMERQQHIDRDFKQLHMKPFV